MDGPVALDEHVCAVPLTLCTVTLMVVAAAVLPLMKPKLALGGLKVNGTAAAAGTSIRPPPRASTPGSTVPVRESVTTRAAELTSAECTSAGLQSGWAA